MGALSDRFGVPLATLASANGIRRPEFLQIGQQLTIPTRATTMVVATGTAMGSAANETASLTLGGSGSYACREWNVSPATAACR